MGKRCKFTLVENVLDINAPRLWYYIPGFNGYEVSDDKYIRSMKHYKKYPFGLLIQPKKYKNGNIIHPEDPLYELSNNNNERVSIMLSQIIHLARTNEYHITGYPRSTCMLDIQSRNSRYFIKKKPESIQPSKSIRYPKFTIIQSQEELPPGSHLIVPEIIVPIESINGGEYFGRKDCRTISH